MWAGERKGSSFSWLERRGDGETDRAGGAELGDRRRGWKERAREEGEAGSESGMAREGELL